MKVSDCCGASHPDAEDYGICPDLREHCDFIEEEEDEDIPLENDELDSSILIDEESLLPYDNDSDFEIGGES